MFEPLIKTVQQAVEPIAVDGHRKTTYVFPNGETVVVDTEANPHNHTIEDLDSFYRCVQERKTEQTSIWIGDDRINARIDPTANEFNQVSLRLGLFDSLIFLAGGLNRMKPKAMRDTIRKDFAGCFPDEFVDLISDLKFKVEEETTAQHTNSSDAMGQAIRAEVTGSATIPETVPVHINIYPMIDPDDPLDSQVIPCTVFTDAQQGTLSIIPEPNAVDIAIQCAKAEIAQRIAEQLNIDPYLGTF